MHVSLFVFGQHLFIHTRVWLAAVGFPIFLWTMWMYEDYYLQMCNAVQSGKYKPVIQRNLLPSSNYPDFGGRRFLRIVGTHVLDYTG
jgi:hypothetical protein